MTWAMYQTSVSPQEPYRDESALIHELHGIVLDVWLELMHFSGMGSISVPVVSSILGQQ